MVWAKPRKMSIQGMPSWEDVPYLRVHQPMHWHTFNQHAATDPGPDGYVNEIFYPAGCAPTVMLRKCRGVDIGIEADGTAKFLPQRCDDVGVVPAGLGRFADTAVMRGLPVNTRGPKHATPMALRANVLLLKNSRTLASVDAGSAVGRRNSA